MSICNFAANWALIYSHLQSVTGEATGEATGKLNLEKLLSEYYVVKCLIISGSISKICLIERSKAYCPA